MRRAALAFVLVALFVVALLVGGGDGGDGGAKPQTAAAAARAAALGFRDAVDQHDYRRLCTRVFVPALLAKLTRAGYPCEPAMRSALGGTHSPRLKILGVRVDGRRARVGIVTSAAGEAAVEGSLGLVKTGDRWLVQTLDTAAPGR